MRIFEIASAEDQLALWKLISDNVWTAISQQARTEAQQKAAAAAKSRINPKKAKKPKKPVRVPVVPKPKPPNKSAVRSSALPTRQPPLPTSQPVLPPVRSSSFSQGDLNRIQAGMSSHGGFGMAPGAPVGT